MEGGGKEFRYLIGVTDRGKAPRSFRLPCEVLGHCWTESSSVVNREILKMYRNQFRWSGVCAARTSSAGSCLPLCGLRLDRLGGICGAPYKKTPRSFFISSRWRVCWDTESTSCLVEMWSLNRLRFLFNGGGRYRIL